MSIKVLQAKISVLEAHDRIAQRVRQILNEKNIKMVDVLGGPGAGKTSVIKQLVARLKDKFKIAYIGGDLATTRDAEELSKLNIPSIQINTGTECHLEAPWIEDALKELLKEEKPDIIFVENVGNLICPFEFDIGAHVRMLIFSVDSGGKEKFEKYPIAVLKSNIIVINKIDVANIFDINVEELIQTGKKMNPKADIVAVSAKTGEGIDRLADILLKRLGIE